MAKIGRESQEKSISGEVTLSTSFLEHRPIVDLHLLRQSGTGGTRSLQQTGDDLIWTIPINEQNRDPLGKPLFDDARLVYEGCEGASTW